MRKFYFLTILVAALSMSSFGQWSVYTADDHPVDADPDVFGIGDNYPGANMFEEAGVMVDTFSVFNYYQPNTVDIELVKSKAMTTYKMPFADNGGEITLVARVKGYGETAYNADSIETIMEFDLRGGSAGGRDKMWITYVDTAGNYNPTVQLREADNDPFYNIGDDDWHTFRMTMVMGTTTSDFTIYMDENATPVLEGTSAKGNSDNYFKFGDGGSSKTGGYVDWVAWDVSGAFAPGEGSVLPDFIFVDGRDDQGSSIGDVNSNSFKVYPNPTKSNTVTVSTLNRNAHVTIFDVTGKERMNVQLNSTLKTLNIDALPTGLYFVQIGTETQKLIIK